MPIRVGRHVPYTTSNKTEVARLIFPTPSSETVEDPREAWNAAGMSRDAIATTNNDDEVWAALISFIFAT